MEIVLAWIFKYLILGARLSMRSSIGSHVKIFQSLKFEWDLAIE